MRYVLFFVSVALHVCITKCTDSSILILTILGANEDGSYPYASYVIMSANQAL